jgi:hypothetical protein
MQDQLLRWPALALLVPIGPLLLFHKRSRLCRRGHLFRRERRHGLWCALEKSVMAAMTAKVASIAPAEAAANKDAGGSTPPQ